MAASKKIAAKSGRSKSNGPKSTRAKPRKAEVAPYTVETFRPKEAIGYLITRTKTALWEEADRVLAPMDITLSQWVIVANLANGTTITPAEICKAMSYDAGAMTRLLDRMEKKGFIRRIRHATDRRSVTLELTQAGRDLYPVLVTRIVAALNQIFTGFTAAEVRQLESYLKRVLVNLGVPAHVDTSPIPGSRKKKP